MLSSELPTRRPPAAALGELPILRAHVVRAKVAGHLPGQNGGYRVAVPSASGGQVLDLEPDPRPIGARWLLRCECTRRTLALHLDPETGRWRCSVCLHLRSARSKGWHSPVFTTVTRPLLDLERQRQRLAHRYASFSNRERFANMEAETTECVAAAMDQLLATQTKKVEHMVVRLEQTAKYEELTPPASARDALDQAVAACSARSPTHAKRYEAARQVVEQVGLERGYLLPDEPWTTRSARSCASLLVMTAFVCVTDAGFQLPRRDPSLVIPMRVLLAELVSILRRHELVDADTATLVKPPLMSTRMSRGGADGDRTAERPRRQQAVLELPPDDDLL